MAEWTLWRSREQVFIKPFTNSKGEDCFRSKDGKTYPAEAFKQQWEKQEEKPDGGS